jgi:hypothetical protein
MKGFAANDVVEGLRRHWERCDVAHEKVASTDERPRFQEIIDKEVETDYFLIASFQGREQNARSATAIEHSVSRAGSETLEDRPIVPFMVIL